MLVLEGEGRRGGNHKHIEICFSYPLIAAGEVPPPPQAAGNAGACVEGGGVEGGATASEEAATKKKKKKKKKGGAGGGGADPAFLHPTSNPTGTSREGWGCKYPQGLVFKVVSDSLPRYKKTISVVFLWLLLAPEAGYL